MNLFRLILALFCSLIIFFIFNQYFFCPRFSFEKPQPFSGKSFYNPYDSINETDWIKCNFHAHSNAWNGFTDGKGKAADIYHAYDSMKYGVHCVSDYQKINTDYINTPGYISAYEHGYNINKTHQLVLGSKKVVWLDYPLPQTLSNKQHVLNQLSSDTDAVVIINHPGDLDGYRASDFKYLTNYNCMEVLSRFHISIPHWDTALSNGHPAFILGNDDVHDIFLKETLGHMCTWINVKNINERTVLNALKTGKGYGMIVGKSTGRFPVLKQFELKNDTILTEMSKPAIHISYSGQNGKILASYDNTASSKYIIKPEDRYVRTTIEYDSGLIIFLNPVFRYDNSAFRNTPPHINTEKTFVFRVMGIVIFTGWLMIAFLFFRSKINREKIIKKFPLRPNK